MKSSIKEVKAFWNNRPCNVKHSSKTKGTKEYFDEVERKKFFVEPHIKTFSHFNNQLKRSLNQRLTIRGLAINII